MLIIKRKYTIFSRLMRLFFWQGFGIISQVKRRFSFFASLAAELNPVALLLSK
jgi:hypothetical protein